MLLNGDIERESEIQVETFVDWELRSVTEPCCTGFDSGMVPSGVR